MLFFLIDENFRIIVVYLNTARDHTTFALRKKTEISLHVHATTQ